MSARRAPMARRRPISRVRSVTETSITFMMPMPPTIRVIKPATASSNPMTVSVARKAVMNSAKLRT